MVTITVEARNNRSISLDLQDFTLDGTGLSGYFLITNQSDGYDVQIVVLRPKSSDMFSGCLCFVKLRTTMNPN
ncbi:MAG: hypothetical protein LWX55_13845 [Deltaproteobacteria bacterium]|jgi:hypothetical protein|nr:hypothetical protein [Deltaproteobacteria bacterium]